MLKITLRRETEQISSTFIPISYISNLNFPHQKNYEALKTQ